MLDINDIRKRPNDIEEGAKKKGVTVDVGRLLDVDERRREAIGALEAKRAEFKSLGVDIDAIESRTNI